MTKTVFLLILLVLWPGSSYGQSHSSPKEHMTYYETGELKSKVSYEKGKKHGIEQIFDKTGKVIEEYYYQYGELMGEVQPEPISDYGSFRFVKSAKFWTILLLSGLTIWFIASKILLQKRPF